MKTALVLGGNGKLGSHLAAALADSGNHVRVFDRFSSPSAFELYPRIEVIQGDFSNEQEVRQALTGVDSVFHCLWSTRPSSLDIDTEQDSELNLIPTLRMLEFASEARVHHAYFMSSGGAVYDSDYPSPYPENSPLRPISPYGVVKVATEGYFEYFRDRQGLDTRIFRIGNLFGFPVNKPTQRGLVSVTLQRLKAGLPVVRFGDGTMERDYLHVQDAARMILKAVESSPQHDVYNIGSGVGRSVNEIFEIIREVIGRDFEIKERPVPKTFQEAAVLDIGRYAHEFGMPQFTEVKAGVATMWEQLSAKS